MGIISALRDALFDLYRGGPGFFVSAVSSKISRAETIGVRLPGDARAVVRPGQSDFSTFRQVFRDQEYRIPKWIADRVDQESKRIRASGFVPVLIDAGANVGAASMWFRSQFPDVTIVAIEPDADNFAIAKKNIAELPDVILMEAAIGNGPGFVSVVTAEHGWAVKTERASAGCPIVTIDQAVKAVPLGKLLAVKIDIEGFESDLFAGNLEWMDEVSLVFIEPHDWMLPGKGTSRSFQKAFGERDFEIILQGENLIYVRRRG